MRTIEQLLAETKAARAEYEARKNSTQKERQEALKNKDKARKDAEKAAAVGDQEAYTKARQEEQYAHDRAQALWGVHESPYFTADQHNKIVSEARQAYNSETTAIYKRLHIHLQECKKAENELKNLAMKRTAIYGNLEASIPPRGGIYSGSAEQQALWKYQMLGQTIPPRSIFSEDAVKDLERRAKFYYDQKEDNGNV